MAFCETLALKIGVGRLDVLCATVGLAAMREGSCGGSDKWLPVSLQ